MRPFLLQRIFGFSIVTACVLWTLLSLQPSDGAPGDEYGTFFDHYGDDLQLLGSSIGEALEKEGGALVLIWSEEYYFQMETLDIPKGQNEVSCHFYSYPRKDNSWPRRRLKKTIRPLMPVHSTTLASAFADKFLPFHQVHCNKLHYMNYIIYGELHINQFLFLECPLAAPWAGKTLKQIASGEFKLEDSNGKKHDFNEYSSSKRPKVVTKTSVSMDLLRSESWLKRTYTLRRKVSKKVKPLPPKEPSYSFEIDGLDLDPAPSRKRSRRW